MKTVVATRRLTVVPDPPETTAPARPHHPEAAVLVASKDGAGTIGDTVRAAVATGVDVYVVSDGSTDRTVETAVAAGATKVLRLTKNVGKPAALFRAVGHWKLTRRYRYLAILDDDTVVSPEFIREALRQFDGTGAAIVVGRTVTNWSRARRWNPFLASRAYGYWRYQVMFRRLQSSLNAMNCISGSNSVYRSEILDQVLVEQTPYIVDDTYWTLEVHRRGLGRIVYAPRARADICDPVNFRDWYRQNLRWLWGTFQGIHGHRVGRRATWFDFWYGLMIADWVLYLASVPFAAWLLATSSWTEIPMLLAWMTAGYAVWIVIAAVALRQWRLVLLTPAILAVDLVYRVIFVHAFVKTLRHPTVESCSWESPARYAAA